MVYQNPEPASGGDLWWRFRCHGTDHDPEPLPSFPSFVYEHARFSTDERSIEVVLRPRKGSAAVCSRCHRSASGYDQLPERRFEFIPFWGFLVFLLYSMRRVDCRRCQAVVVEEVP
jgi:transposase